MRWPEARTAAGIVVAQLVVFALLASSGHWGASTRDLATGAVLVSAEAVLVYVFARALAGPRFGLWAAAVWIAAPALLLRYWVAGGGSPPIPFSPIFHHEYLPHAFGVHSHAAIVAACLLLVACRLVLTAAGGSITAAAAAGLAAGGAALAEPSVWPALAAPALAVLVARRPVGAVAAAGTALAGLLALALFRHVPGIHPGYHAMGASLADVREFSWSLRVLEYLPLAGLVGVARRSLPAAALLGWLFFALVVLPLGRGLGLIDLLMAVRPGLPAYALLAAALPLLIPRSVREVVPENRPAV